MDIKLQQDYILKHAGGLDKKLDRIRELSELDHDEAVIEVIKFLNLIYEYKQKLTPSHVVDLVWHEIILFTKCYADFCEQFYGRFIHHHPGGEDSENQRQYVKTIQLYEAKYGAINSKFWPGSQSIVASCGSCHS